MTDLLYYPFNCVLSCKAMTQGAIRQLVIDSITATLENRVTNMANADNLRLAIGPITHRFPRFLNLSSRHCKSHNVFLNFMGQSHQVSKFRVKTLVHSLKTFPYHIPLSVVNPLLFPPILLKDDL